QGFYTGFLLSTILDRSPVGLP
uniref:Uncharacterized protein n=1 Tax=Megaselia scalaris TaxID=36166 RepID=T1H6B7_MEGSC